MWSAQGSHSVANVPQNTTTPAAHRVALRDGAGGRRKTSSSQSIPSTSAVTNGSHAKWGTKPGASLAKLFATFGGQPVIIAM
jgi:hypothetical protein